MGKTRGLLWPLVPHRSSAELVLMRAVIYIQIKLQSVKLAMKYLKRVSSELEAIEGGPEEEELMLQGVRFAFRVHQVTCMLGSCNKQYTFLNTHTHTAVYQKKNSYIHVCITTAALKHSTLPWSLLRAVCGRIRRGHHASLPGAQGEGVHVPDATAEPEPSSAAAQARC